jgi:hypothetical protein
VCSGTFTLTKDASSHYIRFDDDLYDHYARFRYTVRGAERQTLKLVAVSGEQYESYAGTLTLNDAE